MYSYENYTSQTTDAIGGMSGMVKIYLYSYITTKSKPVGLAFLLVRNFAGSISHVYEQLLGIKRDKKAKNKKGFLKLCRIL